MADTCPAGERRASRAGPTTIISGTDLVLQTTFVPKVGLLGHVLKLEPAADRRE